MFMAEIAKKHDELSNLIKEIQASTDFALRNQKASIKALEIQVRQMSIILHGKLSGNLQSSIEIKPRVNDETIFASVETDKPLIRLLAGRQPRIYFSVIEIVFPYCLYGISKPYGYGVLTFWTLSSLYFQHSLYGVFVKPLQHIRHRYQYGVSWGMDTAYRLPDLAGKKEIDNVGEVSTIWKS
ncbi:hypothetical protein Tco_1164471 [Tanacetum coccineum]